MRKITIDRIETSVWINSTQIKEAFSNELSSILGLKIKPDMLTVMMDDEVDHFMTSISIEKMDGHFAEKLADAWDNTDLPSYEQAFELTEALMDRVFQTRKWCNGVAGRNFSAMPEDEKVFTENFSVVVWMPPEHFEKHLADRVETQETESL